MRRRVLAPLVLLLAACGPKPTPSSAPCFVIRNDSELRAKDAHKTLEELTKNIKLSPEDEQLRKPRTIADVRAILRRDTVYLFADAAAFARSLDTVDGRFGEAALELSLGESQLVASQVLGSQAAWVGTDLRIARAAIAERAEPTNDRTRSLAQLIRVVEEGNKIADALGIVAPTHIARGVEVIGRLRAEAASDVRIALLEAEVHRLRGEWTEFDAKMKVAESTERVSPPLCYLRAMEQLERHRRPDRGEALLKECLEKFPRFVRAQVGLVLMAKTPREALREIAKLKRMNEDHYLVMLLEPTLAADQELGRIRAAASPPPDETHATP